jgi:hypothetical protein
MEETTGTENIEQLLVEVNGSLLGINNHLTDQLAFDVMFLLIALFISWRCGRRS